MYNTKDIQNVGKHDYDKESAEKYATMWGVKSFSVNIFKWGLKENKKEMKRLKCVVRVHGSPEKIKEVLSQCELIVKQLDAEEWDGRKNVFVD